MAEALAVFAALVALVLLLLAVPVAVEFRFQRVGSVRGWVSVRWLFGLVRRQIDWPLVKAAGAPDAHRRGRAHRTGQGHGGKVSVLRLFRDAAFRQRCARLTRDLIDAAHLNGVSLRARLGLGDPADTGRLWAWIGPLGATARSLVRTDLRIEPDFMATVFEFDACGRCRLVPLRFLALALSFVLSPVTIRAWRRARSVDG